MRFRGGFLACASATRISSLVFLRSDPSFSSCCLAVTSTDPRHFSFGRFFSSASSGCMGLYAAVASRPAYFKMICSPPGCSCNLSDEIWSHLVAYYGRTGRKFVTSYTLPSMMTQQSLTRQRSVLASNYLGTRLTFESCAVPRRSVTRCEPCK